MVKYMVGYLCWEFSFFMFFGGEGIVENFIFFVFLVGMKVYFFWGYGGLRFVGYEKLIGRGDLY